MPVPEWSGSDHWRYKDAKRNRIGMDSRGINHVYRDGAGGGGAAWRVQDLGKISDVNKRGELFRIMELRRVGNAIPGNDGTRVKISTKDSKREWGGRETGGTSNYWWGNLPDRGRRRRRGWSHRHVTAASAAHQPNGCQSEGAKDKI